MSHTGEDELRREQIKQFLVCLTVFFLSLGSLSYVAFLSYNSITEKYIKPKWKISNSLPTDTSPSEEAGSVPSGTTNGENYIQPIWRPPIAFCQFSRPDLFEECEKVRGLLDMPDEDTTIWTAQDPSIGYIFLEQIQYFGMVKDGEPHGYGVEISKDLRFSLYEKGRFLQLIQILPNYLLDSSQNITETVNFKGKSSTFKVEVFPLKRQVKIKLNDKYEAVIHQIAPPTIKIDGCFEVRFDDYGITVVKRLHNQITCDYSYGAVGRKITLESDNLIEKLVLTLTQTFPNYKYLILNDKNAKFDIWIDGLGKVTVKYDEKECEFIEVIDQLLPIGHKAIIYFDDGEFEEVLAVGKYKLPCFACISK